VLFGGIKAGQVTAVRPSSEDPTRIEIAFEVQTGTPVNEASTASVGAISLMSSPALSITTGRNEARRLTPGQVVRSEETLTMEEIAGRVASVADSANQLMTQLQKEIPALTGKAHILLADLNQVSGPNNQRQVERILTQVNTLIGQESPKIDQIANQISALAKHVDSAVSSIEPVVGNVDRTVSNVNSTLDAVRDPLTKDLAELDRTIQQARTLLASMQTSFV